MVIKKQELSRIINVLKRIVPSKTTFSALQGILIKDGYAMANNIEIFAKTKVMDCTETMIIPGKMFPLIAALPDGDIELVYDSDCIMLKQGKIKNKYPTYKPEDFIIPTIPDGEKIVIDADDFLAAVRHVGYLVPSDQTNRVMCSMCLEPHEGKTRFVATDNYRVAMDFVEGNLGRTLLIPQEAIPFLLDGNLKGELSINYSNANAVFSSKDMVIVTRLVEGQFFNVSQMFNDSQFNVEILRTNLIDALKRLILSGSSIVKMVFSHDNLAVCSHDVATEYTEDISIESNIDFMIAANSKYLLDSLNNFDDDFITLGMETSKLPIQIMGENHQRALILPVAVNE